jgi:hypothetical protein
MTKGGVRDRFTGRGNAPAVPRFGVTLYWGECPILQTIGHEEEGLLAVPLGVELRQTQQRRCGTKCISVYTRELKNNSQYA